MPPRLLDHLGLQVADLDVSIHYYERVLGFTLIERGTRQGDDIPAGEYALLELGDMCVKLICDRQTAGPR